MTSQPKQSHQKIGDPTAGITLFLGIDLGILVAIIGEMLNLKIFSAVIGFLAFGFMLYYLGLAVGLKNVQETENPPGEPQTPAPNPPRIQ